MAKPLGGMKVVEIGGPPGAFAAMMLADHGADVIKISRPDGAGSTGSGGGASTTPMGRGRRSIPIDLRAEGGAEYLLSLVARADAIIEGYRPGVMERLGVGPAQCLARNRKLVYGRMTGWGQDGPWAHHAGHDVNYVSISGLINAIGERDGPPVMPINIAGDWAGGLLMAFGILVAVRQAERSGHGVVVDTAMVDSATILSAVLQGSYSEGSWSLERASNMTDGGWPFYSIYRAADDRYVSVGALEPQFYDHLVDKLGLTDAGLSTQDDREGWPRMRALFAATFATKTRDQWCEIMEGAEACFAPVLDFEEARAHPHNVARGSFVEHEGVVQPAPAPRFDGKISEIRPWEECDVPCEVTLRDWGLDHDEIARFAKP